MDGTLPLKKKKKKHMSGKRKSGEGNSGSAYARMVQERESRYSGDFGNPNPSGKVT